MFFVSGIMVVGFMAYTQKPEVALPTKNDAGVVYAPAEMVASNIPVGQFRNYFTVFQTPANIVQLQVACEKTHNAWQNLSVLQYTLQIERDGPVCELPVLIDLEVENLSFTRAFDKHLWFSCSKVVQGTIDALLTFVKELEGSYWGKGTVEETMDMATGLDYTEHKEPNDDVRTTPEWARYSGNQTSIRFKKGRNRSCELSLPPH